METSYRELFRNRNYVRVFSAGLGSVAGSSIASVCLVWLVFSETHSALDVGLLGFSFLVPSALFSIFGGTLVDRYDRRRLMIVADLARAAGLALAVGVLAVWGFQLAALLGAVAVLGAFLTIFNPAEMSTVPSLVPASQVADANGLVSSSRSSVAFVGSALGGALIVTVGPLWGIGLNSATFVVSALLLLGMRVAPSATNPRRETRTSSYLADLRAGFRWMWGAQGLLQLTMSATLFNFCSNIVATFLVVYAAVVLHGSALVYASLLAAEVGGSAIGSLLVGRVRSVRYAGKAWVVAYGVASGGVALTLALAPVVPVAVVALFVIGVLAGFSVTSWLSAAQLLVPTDMQGRYFGVDNLGSVMILPISQIGGALLIEAYGTRTTYLIAALLWIAVGVGFLVPRALWNLGVPDSPLPPPTSDQRGS
ncbi:MAG TPA: MFS transporter [Thermoplasmata archaeon]|nr:MFS transporter [Thermoplasmata archaeon]